MIFSKLASTLKSTLSKHMPEILLGAGVAGSVVAIVSTAKATIKSVKTVEKLEDEKGRKLTKKEVAEACWKNYIEPMIYEVGSLLCFFGVDSVHSHRFARVAAACETSTRLAKEYYDILVEEYGKDEEERITKKVAEKEAKIVQTNNIYIPDGAKVLFYEPISKTTFENDLISIFKSLIDLNYKSFVCEWTSFTDFCYALDIPIKNKQEFYADFGNDHGWELINGPIWPDIVPIMDDYGRPLLSIEFSGCNKPTRKRGS